MKNRTLCFDDSYPVLFSNLRENLFGLHDHSGLKNGGQITETVGGLSVL
jgi:hypothetical protein